MKKFPGDGILIEMGRAHAPIPADLISLAVAARLRIRAALAGTSNRAIAQQVAERRALYTTLRARRGAA